jgi:hypothetical protein
MVSESGGSGVLIFHLVLCWAIFAKGSLGRICWQYGLQLLHSLYSLFGSALVLICVRPVLGCRYLWPGAPLFDIRARVLDWHSFGVQIEGRFVFFLVV